MRYLIILTITLMSCTTINHNTVTVQQNSTDYIDSNVEPILKNFEYEARIRGHLVDRSHLSIMFGLRRSTKLDKNGETDKTVGYCAKNPIGGLIIKLYKPAWDAMDESEQEELLFHELGHCLIGRKHCGYARNHRPISIMYPLTIDGTYYSKNREDLVDELFNVDPKCVQDDGHVDEVNGAIRPPTHTDHKR